jgi:LysR family transcriptional regulator, transcriptional activator of nhaA
MERLHELNFHHLRYFWLVAREGSVTAAAKIADVGQPVVSTQLRRLEKHFRIKLFAKAGRGLKLTEAGELVYQYAEDIFRLGRELGHTMRNGDTNSRAARLTVGVTDVVPKLIVYKLLEPVFNLALPVQLVVYEDIMEQLLSDLALNNIDLLLSESMLPVGNKMKVYQHLLGECGVTFFAAPKIAAGLKDQFPKSLNSAPMLLPTETANLRRSLDQWFITTGIAPRIVGEFVDSALIKVFGQAGRGVFALPSAVEAEVTSSYNVEIIGRVETLRERYFAMSAERKIKHPAIVKIQETAQHHVFASPANEQKVS